MSKKLFIPYGFLCVCAALMLLTFPDAVKESIEASLNRCASSLLPSFFPMMILSRQIYQVISFSEGRLSRLLCAVTGFPKKLLPVFFTGLLCGYPAPAMLCKKGLDDGVFTKDEAELAAILCNNASPAFVILLVGNGIYRSISLGIALYIVQTFAVICAAHLLSLSKNETYIPLSRSREGLAESVTRATHAMLEICGFVIFFSLAADAAQKLLLHSNMPAELRIFITGMIETTGGIRQLNFLPEHIKAPYLCAFCSTGGISVYFQISALIKMNFVRYVKLRGLVFLLMTVSFCAVLKIFEVLSLL